MADLSAKKREKIPTKDFGLPEKARTKDDKKESGNYPMPDKAHARNAKARAAQARKTGTCPSENKSASTAKRTRFSTGSTDATCRWRCCSVLRACWPQTVTESASSAFTARRTVRDTRVPDERPRRLLRDRAGIAAAASNRPAARRAHRPATGPAPRRMRTLRNGAILAWTGPFQRSDASGARPDRRS